MGDVPTVLNPFKPAGIYASYRFRGGFVEKLCISRKFNDRFSSFFCTKFFNSIAKPNTNFHVKI